MGVEVALAFLRRLRGGVEGEAGDDLRGDAGGVDHLPLGVAGVDVAAVDGEGGRRGVEGLVLDLAEDAPVEGVGEVGAEAADVEEVDPPADLLVGVKPTRIFPWISEGSARKRSRAVTISATPALSSAPRRVVPSVVTMSEPRARTRPGFSASRITCCGSAGRGMSPPW